MQGSIALGNTTEFLLPLGSTRKTSTTPGTAVQILNNEYSGLLLLQALPGNGGNIAIGDVNCILAAGATQNFIAVLAPSGSLTLPFRSANGLYMDIATSGDGVMISRF